MSDPDQQRRKRLETELQSVREQLTDHLRAREASLVAQIAAIDQASLEAPVPLDSHASQTQPDRPRPVRFESWDELVTAHAVATAPLRRTDAPHHRVAKPKWMAPASRPADDAGPIVGDAIEPAAEAVVDDEANSPWPTVGVAPPAAVVQSDDAAAPPRARKPTAMIVSGLAHVVLILLLAGVSFSIAAPKDQISIAASASADEEIMVETISIETVEMTSPTIEDATEAEPIEELLDGDLPTVDLAAPIAEVVGPPTPPAMTRMLTQSSQAKMMKMLERPAEQTMEFCGVEGGGNHFVYLVDSSRSMGDAFDSAREALLSSINMLTEKQRFYVVFYDSDPDYMRISDPKVDEEFSVTATLENKRRLRAWAMRIGQDRGQNPHEVLQFSLELRPDVIFLLSDGEFPAKVEDLLEQENHVTNLFGETNRISIVHTIGYHSRDGATRMQRIASANGGQYRYVPKP